MKRYGFSLDGELWAEVPGEHDSPEAAAREVYCLTGEDPDHTPRVHICPVVWVTEDTTIIYAEELNLDPNPET